jgi:hypothetical protein
MLSSSQNRLIYRTVNTFTLGDGIVGRDAKIYQPTQTDFLEAALPTWQQFLWE